jgi:hypothetical protein
MEKYKLIVYLPFHESVDALRDSINNTLKFNEQCCVVVSNGSGQNIDHLKSDNVHILERKFDFKRFQTMTPLHIEFVDYLVEKELTSEYLMMLSSNQIFIRHGLYDVMKHYDASYFLRGADKKCYEFLHKSEIFNYYFDDIGPQYFELQSNPDGMFFKYNLYIKMIHYFDRLRDYALDFHADEFFYVAYLLKNVGTEKMMTFENYSYWQPNWRHSNEPIDLDEAKKCVESGYYLMKRVARNYDNDVRAYIRGL